MSIIQKFIEKYGHSIESESVPEEIINKYKNRLPDSIIQFWKEEGFGGFAKGLIWTINPDKYIDYKPRFLELHSNAIPIMRTAFGDLIVCAHTRKGNLIIIIDINRQSYGAIANDINEVMEERFCLFNYFLRVIKAKDFPLAFERLDKISSFECYGYQPPLFHGGEECISNIKIVNFNDYLDSTAQNLNGFVD